MKKKLKNENLLVKFYISNHATDLLKIFLGSLLLYLVPSEDYLLVEGLEILSGNKLYPLWQPHFPQHPNMFHIMVILSDMVIEITFSHYLEFHPT